VVVIIVACWLIASVFTACVPLEAFWNWGLYFTEKIWCQPMDTWWADAGLHIATDAVIFFLPLPVLKSLTLPRRQKYALIAIFCLGFL
jgi:hypothetical protein